MTIRNSHEGQPVIWTFPIENDPSTLSAKEKSLVAGVAYADTGDYHLRPNSPCIDFGLNSGGTGETDLEHAEQAGEGRIPIYEPTVISAPGHYVVTRDIWTTGGSVLDIQSGAVTQVWIDASRNRNAAASASPK